VDALVKSTPEIILFKREASTDTIGECDESLHYFSRGKTIYR